MATFFAKTNEMADFLHKTRWRIFRKPKWPVFKKQNGGFSHTQNKITVVFCKEKIVNFLKQNGGYLFRVVLLVNKIENPVIWNIIS